MMCDAVLVSSIRRATSNPVSPGIWTSRNTRSGCSLSIVVSASTPLPAWPITSMPPTCPSRYPSSSRASCSSSTRTAFNSMSPSRGHPFGKGHERDLDDRQRAASRLARQLDPAAGAVDRPQPLVDVAQADAAAAGLLEALLRHAEAVVVDLDDGAAVARRRADRDAPAANLARQAVLDRILDERLQDH